MIIICSREIGSAAELSGDIPRAYIGNTSDSEYQFNVLRQWLVDCQSRSHFACNTTISGDVLIDDNYHVPLPSRLISVGYPGDKMVYLRNTGGEKGAYITLSYVWGGPGRIPKTTFSNIAERKGGILVSSLPKTFQDVIIITRKLNVPYVWIDALCIIQDDEKDWARQAGQMSRIYQFSLFTVAATGAEDTSRGCFLDRVPTSVEIGPVISLPYRTKEGVVSGRFMVFEQHKTFAEEYDRFVEKSPLLKRGWVFQERVLSRRMVHYTKGKIFFECRTHRFMNECQEGVGKDETQLGFWGPEIKAGTMFPKKDQNPFDSTLMGRWYMAIKIYSQLRLTKTSDKLAAVAGVAREFQMLFSKEREAAGKTSRDGSALHTPLYVSGLWSHDLLYGLSWYPSKPPKLCIAGNKAPSWSWASWHTPIEWPGVMTFKPECRIIVPEMLEQYKRIELSSVKSRQRVKSSELSNFEADLPRGITLDTSMSFLSELQVTGKTREVWRRPQNANCLTTDERKEFSDACEMGVEERHWLQYCHAVYFEKNAARPAGYGCFEDHWLAKSVELFRLEETGAALNGGLDEAEATALLLSLKDKGLGNNKSAPINQTDDDLELAIAASLGKAAPKKAVPHQADLDEEFNDQLAIALMLSAEESSMSKIRSGEAEDAQLAEMSCQVADAGESTNNVEQPPSSIDPNMEMASNVHPTEEPSEEAIVAGNNEIEELLASLPSANTDHHEVDGKNKQLAVIEENTHSTPTIEEDFGTLGHLINHQPPEQSSQEFKGKLNSTPDSPTATSHQRPQIPSRTSSSQPPSSTQPPIPNPQSSRPQTSANDLPQIPAKLHFLPLYSTRATGSLSYLGLSATVYTVLFLREAGEREGRRAFERVGVGKVIEKGFFGKGEAETVVLV